MFSDCTSVGIVSTDKPKTTKIKEDEGMKISLIKWLHLLACICT